MDAVFSMTQVMAWGTLFELPQAVPSPFTLRHWAFIMHRSFQGGEMYEPYIRCYPVASYGRRGLASVLVWSNENVLAARSVIAACPGSCTDILRSLRFNLPGIPICGVICF